MTKSKLKKRRSVFALLMVLGMLMTAMPMGAISFGATSDYTVKSYSVDKSSIGVDETFNLTIVFNGNVNTSGAVIENKSAAFVFNNSGSKLPLGAISGANTYKFPLKYTAGSNVFTFTLVDGATTVSDSITINEAPNVSSSSGGNSTPTDTTKFVPILQVDTEGKIPSMTAGYDKDFKITIKNTGGYTAKDVTLTLEQSGNAFPFESKNVTNAINVAQIDIKSTKEVTFDVNVLGNAKPMTYPIKLKYSFKNNYSDHVFTKEEIFYVKIYNDAVEPILGVVEQVYKGEEVIAGKEDQILLKFKNGGTLTANNIRVQLTGFAADKIRLDKDLDVKSMDRIAKDQTGFVYYNITTDENVKSGTYTLIAKLKYFDEHGTEYTKDIPVYVAVKGVSVSLDNVEFGDVSYADSVAAGNDSTIKVEVKNTSDSVEKNLKVTLKSDASLIFKTPYIQQIKVLNPGETKVVEYKIMTKKETETNSYPTYVMVEREGSTTNESKTEYIGLFIEGAKSMSKPKIIVESYEFGGSNVLAGKEFDLTIRFLNTSSSMGIQNAKVSLSSDDGVFVPADAASSFFIERIPAKGVVEHTIKMKVKNEAQVKLYNVTAEVEYEDAKGNSYDVMKNPYKASEKMGINVMQEIRLEVSDVMLPMEGNVGMPIPVETEFFNMGKADMKNMMVKVEGNFTAQDSNYFVGDFNSGRSEYFSSTIIPNEAGMLEGNIVFEFEDATGERHEIEKPIQVTITEGGMSGGDEFGQNGEFPPVGPDGGFNPEGGMEEQGKNKTWIYVVVGVVVIALVVVFIILRNRKKKRILMEEEDEE